jgi:hypothetical protein
MFRFSSPHHASPAPSDWRERLSWASSWQSHIPPSLQLAFRDGFLWALVIIALVVNLGLFAYLLFEFTRVPAILPPLVPLHFDINGDPDRIESRDALFTLAQIGLIVIIGNLGLGMLMYRRERLAAYLLTATAIVIQLLLWFAAIQIIRVVAL